MANENCREKILSQEYIDFIVPDYKQNMDIVLSEKQACIQNLGFGYRAVHVAKEIIGELSFEEMGYDGIPNCYTVLDTDAMNEAGISALQNYPSLQLQGTGIMIGIIDTGIDYENTVFRDLTGTKIAAIWDQTLQSGKPPEGFDYGSEYSREQINEALRNTTPENIVPTKDMYGHGTFIASLAAGGENLENQFQGAAPKATLGIVKLKEAKQYLKDFYAIKEDALCFQETDIMQGLLYLHRLAQKMEMPLVICIALGSNFGGHNGETILSRILETYARLEGHCVVIGGGNEANQRHHFRGELEEKQTREVELRVEEGDGKGFVAEIWSSIPNILTAYLISPTGERSPEITIRQGNQYRFTFAFDQTSVEVEYRLLLNNNNSLLIFLRFLNPSSGIWKIGLTPVQVGDGVFHIWLPVREFLENDVYFLESEPDITLTEPGSTKGAITVAYYNGLDNSVAINSGRGYTRSNLIKPDFASPGVQVTGASNKGRFVKRSGSSVAAGITAGACALVMEWLKKQPESRSISTSQVANILILGAEQDNFPQYPNQEWGYGTLDVYQSLDRFRRL